VGPLFTFWCRVVRRQSTDVSGRAELAFLVVVVVVVVVVVAAAAAAAASSRTGFLKMETT
jgi:uncharacterized Tic20 family protein